MREDQIPEIAGEEKLILFVISYDRVNVCVHNLVLSFGDLK